MRSPAPQSSLSFLQHSLEVQKASGLDVDKAVAFLNSMYRQTQEKIDLLLVECGDYKVSHEKLVENLDETASRVIVEINSVTGERRENEFAIQTNDRDLTKQNEEFGAHRAQCAQQASQFQSEIEILRADVNGVTQLQTLAKKCDGKTLFLQRAANLRSRNAKIAVRGLLSSVHGKQPWAEEGPGAEFSGEDFSHFDESERGDEMDEGPVKGDPHDMPDESFVGNMCPIGGGKKLCCGKLVSKLREIHGAVKDELTAKEAAVQKHMDVCERVLDEMKMEIRETRNALHTANTRFSETSAYLAGLGLQRNMQTRERHDLCKAIRDKYTSCHKDYEALEKQLCTLIKVRQNLYEKLGGTQKGIIRDCAVGEWIPGPCSQSCAEDSKTPGLMMLRREILLNKGPHGADCPPVMMQMDCNAVPCPTDCKMSEWSEWGECTKNCGGGVQMKTRSVLVAPTLGGDICPGKGQRRTCNSESCDVDCGLTEWTAWGACSKACRANEHSDAGRMYRKRHIRTPVKGKGKCPMPHSKERLEYQSCNFHTCPADIKCEANLDLLVLLDGGGGLMQKEAFDAQVNVAKILVKNSTLDTSGKDKKASLMRFGFIYYSDGYKLLSTLTGDKDELTKALGAATWDAKGADVGEALQDAKRVFRYTGGGSGTRLSTALLFTDGTASQASLAYEAARELRESGVRLFVALVSEEIRGVTRFKLEQNACAMASQPCRDNLEIFASWANVEKEARRLMVGACPTIGSDLI
jgi:hypothetical protein